MNLGELLKKYKQHPRLFYLADRLSFASPSSILPEGEEEKQKIFLKNLQGSSAEFVLAALFDKYQNDKNANPSTHLVILNDAEEAAYFHNTLENLTQALNLFYFPSNEVRYDLFVLLKEQFVLQLNLCFLLYYHM